MTRYEFIFSNKLSHRVSRHLLFWLIFILHTYLFRYYVGDLKYLSNTSFYIIRLQNLLLFLPVAVFYAYFTMYFLLPVYILKDRYFRLLIVVLVMAVVLVLLSYQLAYFFNVRLAFDLPLSRQNAVRQMDFTVSNGLVYPLTVSGFAIGIKMSKNFYLQQKQNELLAKQKIDAEVLLLKSQVHPRFLFHSLNNIYRQMRAGSSQSAGMLLKLSDLLSYILYESDDKAVPLEKELSLLQNYIDLEHAGWGQSLSFTLRNETDPGTIFIAPLILLPVTEYVFEEADKNRSLPLLLTLDISKTKNDCRFFFTVEGEARPGNDSFRDNQQLLQVQKRLQVLYPGMHHYEAAVSKNLIDISISVQFQK